MAKSHQSERVSNYEMLERELTLKQLQINRLLDITQAINNNLPAPDLYKMYNSFLAWELGVKKMLLYVLEDEECTCVTSIGVEDYLSHSQTIKPYFPTFSKLQNIEKKHPHPLIAEFDVVLPVIHKKSPIAFAFIGGFGENDDMYNKIQFIATITNIVAVAIENKRLFKRQIEQERLKKEMELAVVMQNMLIPSTLPSNEHYELASIYKPHSGVGGDYFDFIDYDDPRFAFCIADISGKGLAAALLMSNFQATLRSLINKRIDAESFIKELNTSILEAAKGEKFITFFIAEYNQATRQLIYVNAGHNPPILITGGKTSLLEKGCTILGHFDPLPSIEVGKLTLEDDALILTFTDGLTDIQNEQGEYFDEMKLISFINHHHSLSASGFNKQLLKYIDVFRNDTPFPDDFSVLTCKIFKN